jgi:hypothetical protein
MREPNFEKEQKPQSSKSTGHADTSQTPGNRVKAGPQQRAAKCGSLASRGMTKSGSLN